MGYKIKQRFQQFAYKFQIWMQGRYGYDEFSRFLSIFGIALLLISNIGKLSLLYIPGAFCVIFSSVRMYSKKLEKRRRERAWYIKKRDAVKSFFSLTKRRWRDRKTFAYFRCSRCGTVMRVPKGKGKIKITCPKCHQETFKKS